MPRQLNCLRRIYKLMKENHSTRATMHLQMHEKPVHCVFSVLETPFFLLLTTQGSTPLRAQYSVVAPFTIQTEYIDDIGKWATYFGFEFNPDNRYTPLAFWNELEKEVNKSNPILQRTYAERAYKYHPQSSSEEKIYFIGFRVNPYTQHTSQENFNKTQAVFGEEVADKLYHDNISTCWSSNQDEENVEPIIKKFPTIML